MNDQPFIRKNPKRFVQSNIKENCKFFFSSQKVFSFLMKILSSRLNNVLSNRIFSSYILYLKKKYRDFLRLGFYYIYEDFTLKIIKYILLYIYFFSQKISKFKIDLHENSSITSQFKVSIYDNGVINTRWIYSNFSEYTRRK